MAWMRYVAIGDSSTEGLDDPAPDGGYRGWADRLASLVAAAQGGLEYANLAVRGRLAHEIASGQLPVALDLRPNLVSVVAGMNDLLRPSFDVKRVMRDVATMQSASRDIGATVVTFTLPAPGPGMPLARVLAPRVARFNRALRAVAEEHGAVLLDLQAHSVASDPRLWSADRLHANSEGHRRIAAGLAQALGVSGVGDAWAEPLPRLPQRPLARAVLADLGWARAHLVPWIARRVRGASSGDGLRAKRPLPLPVDLEIAWDAT